MSTMKVAIVYYSTYGLNYEMAQIAAEAAAEVGAEVRLRKVRETVPDEVVQAQPAWAAHAKRSMDIEEATPEDLVWADAFLFSTPTRYGGAASQMRAFIDTLGPTWQAGQLADKCVSAMTSAGNTHGGQETTLHTLYYTFMHWGAILVPPGYTDPSIFAAGGNPYGVSVNAKQGLNDDLRAAIRHQARRLVELGKRFKR